MAHVIPFKAIRPEADKVHLVASRSVDGYNSAELKDKLAGNPFTFLHIINPDFGDGRKTKPGSRERLQKVKNRFKQFLREDVFHRDEKPCYYIYRQMKEGHTYTGIIACTSIDDYLNGVIRIHEQTLTEREEKLKDYLEVCEFNAEPVLFFYPNDQTIDEFTQTTIKEKADYDFTTTDRVRHSLWVISKTSHVRLLAGRFKQIPSIYIADGHHRSASSALLGKLRKSRNLHHTGKEAYNYYLGAFFPESELKIYDYNRIVKDLGGLSPAAFLQKLEESFEIHKTNQSLYCPGSAHEFSLYLDGNWYQLHAKKTIVNHADPIESLDAFLLSQFVLDPLLGIKDLKTDKRIAFVPGIKGPQALKKAVDEGRAAAAFGLYPVSMHQLKWIADTNHIMPPKTTWVEPKMRSGLVIYSLQDGNQFE